MPLAGKMVPQLAMIPNSPAIFLVAVVINAHQATVTSTVRRLTDARKSIFRSLTTSTYGYVYSIFHVDALYVSSGSNNNAFQIAVRIPGVLVQILARAYVGLRRTVGHKRKSAKPLAFKTVVLFRTRVSVWSTSSDLQDRHREPMDIFTISPL